MPCAPHAPLRRRWMAWLVVIGAIAAACGDGGEPATAEPPVTVAAASSTSTTAEAPTSTPAPTVGSATTSTALAAPSQTPSDAGRDGVIAELAALPMSVRVDIVDAVSTEEGVWAISRLTEAADSMADGCRLGPEDGKYPTDFICTTEYGELLLLDAGQTEILRAYPLPGVPAEFLAVTDDAVYCGRHGELPMPDAMICRIDRATQTGIVKVYQPGLDSLIVQPCFFPPDTWTVIEDTLEMTALVATTDGVFTGGLDGTWTLLDPSTLEIVERNVAPPSEAGA